MLFPFLLKCRDFINGIQLVGILMLGLLVVSAIAAPMISDFDPDGYSCAPFQKPDGLHLLGCNDVGQDIWAQLLYGARTSLLVGVSVALLATVIATFLAIIAGYSAGQKQKKIEWLDIAIMRGVDIALSLPFLPLVIVLGVYFGATLLTQIFVISLVMWAYPVRELRAQILSLRTQTYITAARTMGAGLWHISWRHLLPQILPLVMPQFVRIAHQAILIEAALSFLGLGDPLQNSWGSILFHANARTAFLTGSWTYWIVPPGLAIGYTVLSFALISYGFEDRQLYRLWRGRPERRHGQKKTNKPDISTNLQVSDLTIAYDDHQIKAVDHVSFTLQKGGFYGLIGESGSGKSTIAAALMGLLPDNVARVEGQILYQGQDLFHLSAAEYRQLRTQKIAYIPQMAMNALNPVLTIGQQIAERLSYGDTHKSDIFDITYHLERVGLSAPHQYLYPHQLSGGMRQRAVIAIAMAIDPDIVIADEPTTGLDILVQQDIMTVLAELQQKLGLTILLITHNLSLSVQYCQNLMVMYQGQMIEQGPASQLARQAEQIYTRTLFLEMPGLRDSLRWRPPYQRDPNQQTLIAFSHMSHIYPKVTPFWSRQKQQTDFALKDINCALYPGEVIGLIGGSGAGKSTLTQLLTGELYPQSGQILFEGQDISSFTPFDWHRYRQQIHLVFQDPYQSLNNRLTVRDILYEPLQIEGDPAPEQWERRCQTALEKVSLPTDQDFLTRKPISLSGGQRQRLAFARAVMRPPKLILADEPTSMLDQAIRGDLMQVMSDLCQQEGTAFLFITHDIPLARHFCHRLWVLKQGEMVEQGQTDQIIHTPQHPYTSLLIDTGVALEAVT